MTTPRTLTLLKRAADGIERQTPAHRDRAIDGLRALALLAVPTGHWLLGGFTLDSDGGLHNASPLSSFGGLAPASWVLQMLGIFFLVGGYASALSFRRHQGSAGAWLKGRIVRLGRPVLGVTAVWALAAPVLYAAGVPEATLRTGATLVIQPLWFVGVYVVITALTPYCVRAAGRLGGWAAAPLLVSVAVVDFLRYGPLAGSVPGWVSLLNILPGWLFAYQLGVSWGEGRIGRRGAGCCWRAGRCCSRRCSRSSTTRRRWWAYRVPRGPTPTRRRCSYWPWRRASRVPRSCCATGWRGCWPGRPCGRRWS